MQLFSWMTWIVSLILAVGALLNISHTLDAQTLPLTWQQKYIIVITAAWPLYIAFTLALLAGVGATLEILAETPSRSATPSPITPPDKAVSKKPARNTRPSEDSYMGHLMHQQSSEREFEPIRETPAPSTREPYEPRAEAFSQDTAALAHLVPSRKKETEKADDLEFFRM